MDLSSRLVLVHDSEPVINTIVEHQGRELDLDETNSIRCGEILIPASQNELLRRVGNLKSENITPNWGFSSTTVDLSLVFLSVKCNGDIWAHFTHKFSIAS